MSLPEHTTNYSNSNKSEQGTSSSSRKREPEPKFVDTINPLLKFSNDELEQMNEEFDEFFESSSSSSDDEPIDIESPPINKKLKLKRKREMEEEVNLNFFKRSDEDTHAKQKILGAFLDENSQAERTDKNSSSSDDEMPSTKFRRGGDLPSDLDMGSDNSVGSDGPIDEDDDGQWNMMGAALEREFLGLDE